MSDVSGELTFDEAERQEIAGWLTALRLDPLRYSPEIYTIRLQAKNDWPITHRGRIVLFTTLALAPEALRLDDDPAMHRTVLPTPLSLDGVYIYDLSDVLVLLKEGDYDANALVVDFLNMLLDLIAPLAAPLPIGYRRALFRLANYMTFDRDLGQFFSNETISRETVQNAIAWCIGTIFLHSTILKDDFSDLRPR